MPECTALHKTEEAPISTAWCGQTFIQESNKNLTKLPYPGHLKFTWLLLLICSNNLTNVGPQEKSLSQRHQSTIYTTSQKHKQKHSPWQRKTEHIKFINISIRLWTPHARKSMVKLTEHKRQRHAKLFTLPNFSHCKISLLLPTLIQTLTLTLLLTYEP